MSTPNGQQEPYEQNPYQPGQQPARAPQGQETYAPEEDIPRQQASREDQYTGPRQGQGVPPQGAGWVGDQQGTYGAYPSTGEYYAEAAEELSYLNGAPVDFQGAVRGAVGNVFTYRGRASRSAFWWFALVAVIIYLVMGWISDASRVAGIIVDIVVGVPLFLTSLSLAVRRLHDRDMRGWWWLIGFIPLIGGIILLIFYVLPGTHGPNRFNVAR